MDLGIQGRSAVVAASTSGLGFAVARELLQEGCQVWICGRDSERFLKAKSDLEIIAPGRVFGQVCDITIAEQRDMMMTAAIQQFGHVDILVTNSGGPPPGSFDQHDDQAWEDSYRLLLASAVGLIRGVLPGMKAQSWGRIITITSQAVKQPVDDLILSNTVRSSLLGLVRSLANELGPVGITVNNVMPGFTRTERLERLLASSDAFENIEQTIPLRRIGEPNEFAAMVAFYASQKASYITGTSVAVDGGWIKSIL